MARTQAQAPFQFDPQLTAVANLSRNTRLIADEVFPVVPVTQETFKYLVLPEGDDFTIPETIVGIEGEPNIVHASGDTETDAVDGHALIHPVPRQLQEQSQPNYDPMGRATEMVTNLLLLKKEKDVADMVFDSANYNADNVETLSSSDQWSDPTSDPIKAIVEANDTLVMEGNILVLGKEVATALRIHPAILKSFHANDGDSGVAPLSHLASVFGFDQVLVGSAWYNAKNLGQDPSLTRLFSKSAAILHRSQFSTPTARGIMTLSWGVSFTWPIGGRSLATFNWFDPAPGVNGTDKIKVASRYKHIVVAKNHGYLFLDAVE
jgi:hypothetical protein